MSDFEFLYTHLPHIRPLSPARPNDRLVLEGEMERIQLKIDSLQALLNSSAHNVAPVITRRNRKALDHWDAIETQLFRLLTSQAEHAPDRCKSRDCEQYAAEPHFAYLGHCVECQEAAMRGERSPSISPNPLPRPVVGIYGVNRHERT